MNTGTWFRNFPLDFVSLFTGEMNESVQILTLDKLPISGTGMPALWHPLVSPSFSSSSQRRQAPCFSPRLRLVQNSLLWEPKVQQKYELAPWPRVEPISSGACPCCGSAAGEMGPVNVHTPETHQLPDYGFLRGGVCALPFHVMLLPWHLPLLFHHSYTYSQWHLAGRSVSAAQRFLRL